MDSAFAQFIRLGGPPSVTLRPAAPERKDEPGSGARRAAFARRLGRASADNASMILDVLAGPLRLGPGDLAPDDEDVDAGMAAWDAAVGPLADPSDRARIEDRIASAFAADLNERRQGALGIEGYTWRSRDDALVRPGHAAHDDQAFRWEEPPEGGHPGEAWGCRCWAEPFVEDQEDGPLRGLALTRLQLAGASAGVASAVRQVVADGWASLVGVARLGRDLGRWAWLEAQVRLGSASEADLDELRRTEAAFAARVDGIKAALAALPQTASAFLDYVDAVERRAEVVTDLYLQGLATEGDVHDAFEESTRLRLLILGSVVPVSVPRRLLGALGHTDLPDGDALGPRLADEVLRLRRRPGDVDLGATMPDPGIPWDRGIRDQGRFWEDVLEQEGTGQRLHETFKAFDFWIEEDNTAISAKTFNATTPYRVSRPSELYRKIRNAVDAAMRFDEDDRGGLNLTAERVRHRVVMMAIRGPLTDLQVTQLRRGMEHAEAQGVELVVRMIQ